MSNAQLTHLPLHSNQSRCTHSSPAKFARIQSSISRKQRINMFEIRVCKLQNMNLHIMSEMPSLLSIQAHIYYSNVN